MSEFIYQNKFFQAGRFDDEILSSKNVQSDSLQRNENLQAPHELQNLPSLHRSLGRPSAPHQLRYCFSVAGLTLKIR